MSKGQLSDVPRIGDESQIVSLPPSYLKRTHASITSEYSILTDLAANLGSYKLNRDAPSTLKGAVSRRSSLRCIQEPFATVPATRNRSPSVQEEAELLLNFMTTAPSSADTPLRTNKASEQVTTRNAISQLNPTAHEKDATSSGRCKPVVKAETANTTTYKNNTTATCTYQSTISPSFSFEAKRQEPPQLFQTQEDNHIRETTLRREICQTSKFTSTTRPTRNESCPIFSLSCPSLSLIKEYMPTPPSTLLSQPPSQPSRHPVSVFALSHSPESSPLPLFPLPSSSAVDPNSTSPSYLFSRPIQTRPSNVAELEQIANDLASNVMQSFITALHWRMQTWIKALSRVLSIRFQIQKNQTLQGKAASSSSASANGNKAKRRKTSKAKAKGKGKNKIEVIKEELKKSKESRVIRFLTQASSNIAVHDVRTTFFLLEKQMQQDCFASDEEKKDDDQYMHLAIPSLFPPPPRHKKRRTSSSGTDVSSGDETVNTDNKRFSLPYRTSHAITLHTRCSVSTSPVKKMTVSFRTPGKIHGKFVRDRQTGDMRLENVSITLDTDALAASMDENSRLVVRAACEESMISPPLNYCTIYDTVHKQQQTMPPRPPLDTVSSTSDESDMESRSSSRHDPYKYYSDRNYHSYFHSPNPPRSFAGDLNPSNSPFAPLVTPNLPNIVDGPNKEHDLVEMPVIEQVSSQGRATLSLPLDEDALMGKDKEEAGSVKKMVLTPRRRVSRTDSVMSSDPKQTKKSGYVDTSNRHHPHHQSFASPKAHKVNNQVPPSSTDRQLLVATPPPSLVSPIPNHAVLDTDVTEGLETAPTMPALLEVARAAHAKCH